MLDYEQADLVQPGGHGLPDGLASRLSLHFLDRPAADHGPAQRLRVMVATHATEGEPRGTIVFSPGRTEFIE
ncbi:MAG: hypothetical protein WBF53_15995, partial [Litorimonas sp.]